MTIGINKNRKRKFIRQFKKFIEEYGRRPNLDEIKNHELFQEYTYKWMRFNVGRLVDIERRIEQGRL